MRRSSFGGMAHLRSANLHICAFLVLVGSWSRTHHLTAAGTGCNSDAGVGCCLRVFRIVRSGSCRQAATPTVRVAGKKTCKQDDLAATGSRGRAFLLSPAQNVGYRFYIGGRTKTTTIPIFWQRNFQSSLWRSSRLSRTRPTTRCSPRSADLLQVWTASTEATPCRCATQ